ncbi:hypothetical protein [Nocardia albiluteola]|uniref:hypothetical protein n=1 Tax=Nocardia albiluteola TaxID=2842303 RepID=UPI001FDA6139
MSLPAGLPFAPGRALFAEAAFGDRPGIAAAALPAADDAVESWLRGVVLGGQGRYAGARAELGRTRRLTRDPVLWSLAASTEASLLRQLGWHAHAATVDGRALALAARAVAAPGVDAAAEPMCDALTGLAADALGTARPALAARLLERCRGPVEAAGGWRPRLRWHWVCAETALAAPGSGLIAAPALEHAEAAVEIARQCPSIRHRVKSALLLAAASAAGAPDRSAAMAAVVAEQCAEYGLLPLRWATAMLRSGVETGSTARHAAAEAAECARELAVRGGRLRSETGVLGAA